MVGRERVVQVAEHLLQLLDEVVRRPLAPVALEREGGALVRPGCAPDPEIDAAREQPREHAERFGDLERAVMREHHPAAPHADP